MNPSQPTRVAMIGCGKMARGHVRGFATSGQREIVVVCDPSAAAYAEMGKVFADTGLPTPPNQPDLGALLSAYRKTSTLRLSSPLMPISL